MNWLDILLLAVIGLSTALGIARGFARVVIGFAAAILGLVLATWCYGTAGSFLIPYVSHKSIANLLGFVLVFSVIVLLGALAGRLAALVFKWIGLSWLDRLLGGLFGFVRGMLFAIVVVMVLLAFSWEPPPHAVVNSAIAPYVIDAAGVLAWIAPREVKDGFHNSYERVKKVWDEALKKGSA